jgi:signal transduction histidine kinase
MKKNITQLLNVVEQFIIRRRYIIMLVVSLMAIISETIDHFNPDDASFDSEYLSEILLLAFILPMIGLLLLELMKRIIDDQRHTALQFHKHKIINQQLGQAKDWDELVNIILQFPQTILAVEATALWLQDVTSTRLILVKTWGDTSIKTKFNEHPVTQPPPEARINFLTEANRLPGNKEELIWFNPGGPPNSYSLSLKYNDQQIGILQMICPAGTSPSEHQLHLLSDISPAMALAMHVLRLQKTVYLQNKTIETTRQRVAHDLHDILGQDLAYLRYKLEKLSLDAKANSSKEIQRMQTIAEEAYDVVRGTISSLETGHSSDMISLLPELAQAVADRAEFEVHFLGSPNSHWLPSEVQNQVVYIYREILNNIEKHARACKVIIHQQWTYNEFRLTVTDDGKGFEPADLNKRGHFGLAIMQDRANQIDGRLIVVSHPGEGTKITLHVPLVSPTSSNLILLSNSESNDFAAGKTYENHAGG